MGRPAGARARPAAVVALQFHPEVAHTPQGLTVLQNFCYDLCGCEPTWTPGSFIAEAVERIRATGGRGARPVRRLRRAWTPRSPPP